MTLKRTCWTVLVLLVLTGHVGAGVDIEYVDGLTARRYYALAIAHLEKMQKMTDLGEADRTIIPLKLGSVLNLLAAVTPDPARKEVILTRAARHLDEFAAANPTHPSMLDVRLQQVDIQSLRAGAMQLRYMNEKNVAKRNDLRTQIEAVYKKALDAAKGIVDATTEPEKKARGKAAANPKNKKMQEAFWSVFGPQVRGMFTLGHLEYLWAQLYPVPAKERKTHLESAVKHFDVTSGRNPKTNVTYEAHVRRGMCLRELSAFERNRKEKNKKLLEAVKAFDAALTVQSTAQTQSTRAEAHFQKAVTALLMDEYEAAVAGADGYLRESTTGKNSQRGQRALLVKAEALGKLAEKCLKDPERQTEWEDIYNQARAALKDISPQYRDIRKDADALIQGWIPKFPTLKAEVVISPLIAASEAKRLEKSGDVAGAVDKYRQVITLSAGRAQFAQFEQEAWKTIGQIYYKKRRFYMATIAWRELLKRFPDTKQGRQLGWASTRILAWVYTHSAQKDAFDLDVYLDSLMFFIKTFPKDENVFKAQTEIAKVYDLQGRIVDSAKIWGSTDPGNVRYAETMLNAAEKYRQAFLKLADANGSGMPEASRYLVEVVKHFKLAAAASLPEGAAMNYNAEALVRQAEFLADDACVKHLELAVDAMPLLACAAMNYNADALPQLSWLFVCDPVREHYLAMVPGVLTEFRQRFAADTARLSRVMLAAVRGYIAAKLLPQADVLTLELEGKHGETESCALAIQEMVVAYQQAGNAVKANDWRKKQITDPETTPIRRLLNAARQSWKGQEYPDATRFYVKLVARLRKRIDDLRRKRTLTAEEKTQLTADQELLPVIEKECAEVLYEAKMWAPAIPLWRKFLADARAAAAREKKEERETAETREALLTAMKRLAECEEMGGNPQTAITLWEEFSTETFRRPRPTDEWYNARYHLANAHARAKQNKDAERVLKRVEVFYGGFGRKLEKYPDLAEKVKKLRERIK